MPGVTSKEEKPEKGESPTVSTRIQFFDSLQTMDVIRRWMLSDDGFYQTMDFIRRWILSDDGCYQTMDVIE